MFEENKMKHLSQL